MIRTAVRQDWPVKPDVQAMLVERLVSYLDPTCENGASAPDRIVIAAARALAAFCGLALKQQAIDLAREKLEGRKSDIDLTQLVSEAEQRALERKRERDEK